MNGAHRRDPVVLGDGEYFTLNQLSMPLSSSSSSCSSIDQHDHTFTLCLWIYLLKTFGSGSVLRMVCTESKAEKPFLEIDQSQRLSLHLWSGGSLFAQEKCPIEKWVHIGCEVGSDVCRLHMDGVMIAEISVASAAEVLQYRTLSLRGGRGNQKSDTLQGYAHHVQVLPQLAVTNHYVKHPPLELSLDGSMGPSDDHGIEEGGDGIWSVVGGKASCRRNFGLDVVLLDALGRSIHKDMEVIALLVYADNGLPVGKPRDGAEAPLLITCDGIEFPSTERAIRLVHGRASFKLKISQLSSKCDNRLFRVCFYPPHVLSYPFLRVFSRPIRCVSRNRNMKAPLGPLKRCNSFEAASLQDETIMELPFRPTNTGSAHIQTIKKSCFEPYSTKRARVFTELSNFLPDQPVNSCERSQNTKYGIRSPSSSLQKYVLAQASGCDTRCSENEQSCASRLPLVDLKQMDSRSGADQCRQTEIHREAIGLPNFEGIYRHSVSDNLLSEFFVFKYSLENTCSRAAFLRGVATCWTDEDLQDFAKRVALATSCEHTGHQIVIAKKLIHEGNEEWKQILKEASPVPWDVVVEHVEKQFHATVTSSKRRFSSQEKSLLKQLSRCKDHVTHEDFDRLWCLVYPMCLSLSNPAVHMTWELDNTKDVMGIMSRQEAEALLTSKDMPKPGTFIIRFVSTCSWPHPDAGGLIVSYVGQDLRVHHKLVSLDNFGWSNPGHIQPLSELISAHEELLLSFA